jgi:Flp pilus assembly protein TadD
LAALQKVRDLMGKVIEIQPAYQGATAYVALAAIELKTEFFGGEPEKAVAYLTEAVRLNPENFLARLTLAEAYIALERDAEAKRSWKVY